MKSQEKEDEILKKPSLLRVGFELFNENIKIWLPLNSPKLCLTQQKECQDNSRNNSSVIIDANTKAQIPRELLRTEVSQGDLHRLFAIVLPQSSIDLF